MPKKKLAFTLRCFIFLSAFGLIAAKAPALAADTTEDCSYKFKSGDASELHIKLKFALSAIDKLGDTGNIAEAIRDVKARLQDIQLIDATADRLCTRASMIDNFYVYSKEIDETERSRIYDGQTALTQAVVTQIKLIDNAASGTNTILDALDIVLKIVKASGGQIDATNNFRQPDQKSPTTDNQQCPQKDPAKDIQQCPQTAYQYALNSARAKREKGTPGFEAIPGDRYQFIRCQLISSKATLHVTRDDADYCNKISATNYTGKLPYSIAVSKRDNSNPDPNPDLWGIGAITIASDSHPVSAPPKEADPQESLAKVVGKSLNSILANFSASSASSPVTPDTFDNQAEVPSYVSTLLGSSQGISLSNKTTNGVSKPSAQGELRYTFDARPLRNYTRFDSGTERIFLYVNGDINPYASSPPLNPEWLSFGLGANHLLDLTSARNATEGVTTWLSQTARIGRLENRLPVTNLFYNTAAFSETLFTPVLTPWTGKSHPLYAGITAGLQHQWDGSTNPASPVAGLQTKYQSSNVPQPVPSNFTFGRLDLYGYPCELFGICPTDLLSGPSSVTMHLFHQVTSSSRGYLDEADVTWNITKSIGLSLSRTIGIQDPLTTFGAPQQKSGITAVTLKFKSF